MMKIQLINEINLLLFFLKVHYVFLGKIFTDKFVSFNAETN